MKIPAFLLLAALAAALTSCGLDTPPDWNRSFNPLDTPGSRNETPIRIATPNWWRTF